MQKTLAIIKPDAFQAGVTGSIIQRIEDENFRIAGMRLVHMNTRQAEGFYYVHRQKPFFRSLIEFMTSGPCVLIVLEGRDVIGRWRILMGPTDPSAAEWGTLRREYGTSIERNAVHGSDSEDSAVYEINYLFKGTDLVS